MCVWLYISHQEYIIKREGEYPTPVYLSVVTLDRGPTFIIIFVRVEFHCTMYTV